MALILSGEGLTINYAGRSYTDHVDGFMTLADRYTPQWTDRSELDPGVLLAGNQARIGQWTGYYINRRAEEHYVATARLMSSIRNIGKLFGYTPAQPTTATVDMVVVTSGAGTIPRLFSVASDPSADMQPVVYELLDSFACPAAGQYVLTFHHGETRDKTTIGRATGAPMQTVTIRETPIATNSDGYPEFQLDVLEGDVWVRWEKVANFLQSLATSRHYTAVYNDRSELVIQCGDGITGRIWPGSTSSMNLRATYRIGGGLIGNRPGRGTIRSISDAKGCTIVTSVINLSQPSGGKAAETLAQAKVNLPLAAAARDSIVTFPDAISEIRNSGLGVSRLKLEMGNGPYDVIVTVAATGGSPKPSGSWDAYTQTGTGLLGAVGGYITARCTESWILRVVAAVPVPVVCRMEVTCVSWAYRRDVEARVKTAVTAFLKSDNQDLGGKAKFAELAQTVENLDGVDSVEITQFYRIPRATFKSGLNVVSFSNYAISERVDDEVWTVRFIDTKRFKVIGSKSGEQKTIGTVLTGASYTTDGGQLSFRATASTSTPPSSGTTYTLRTSPFVGTISVDAHEIITNGSTSISMLGGIS